MIELSHESAYNIYKNQEIECVFNIDFNLSDCYTIYRLGKQVYIHHINYDELISWFLSSEEPPDQNIVEEILRSSGVDKTIQNCSVNAIDIDVSALLNNT